MLKDWEKLPEYMRTEEVRPYYDYLKSKRVSLFIKRLFDILMSLILLILLSPLFLILALAIALDSKGGVFFRQTRITQYGRPFRIHKFRTMVSGADKMGTQVTVEGYQRITRVGQKIRKYRLDEIPQLIDIFKGDMTFVGTRPESPFYVKHYTAEMYATLLLPAGVTSEASIRYKDEQTLLQNSEDTDKTYIEKILPEKMQYNLEAIKNFNLKEDFKLLFKTIAAVLS